MRCISQTRIDAVFKIWQAPGGYPRYEPHRVLLRGLMYASGGDHLTIEAGRRNYVFVRTAMDGNEGIPLICSPIRTARRDDRQRYLEVRLPEEVVLRVGWQGTPGGKNRRGERGKKGLFYSERRFIFFTFRGPFENFRRKREKDKK